MNVRLEIDGALRQLGNVAPPDGMEQRILHQLQTPPRRLSWPVLSGVAGGALAAGVALFAVAPHPGWRPLILPRHDPATAGGARVAPAGGFGASAVVRVPAEPVPVQPAPVNQGRGHARSGRATLPTVLPGPLPRGVAPGEPAVRTGSAN